MYYRLLDETTQKYLSNGYNEDSQKYFKRSIEEVLSEKMGEDDVTILLNSKWDTFRKDLRKYDLILEEGSVPFLSSDLDESFEDFYEDDEEEDYFPPRGYGCDWDDMDLAY